MINVIFTFQDFLGLVEKLYYLSGKYEIQLTIGDASMVSIVLSGPMRSWFNSQKFEQCDFPFFFQENSLLRNIGHIELDLPERPEKASLPPLRSTDPYTRYEPKAEISHIFRVPEKLPAKQLSLVFLGLIVLPFVAFLIGVSLLSLVNIDLSKTRNPRNIITFCFKFDLFLFQLMQLGVNIKSFPSSVGPATSALLFHGGIGAVLLLYVLFWLKASSQNQILL